MEALKPHQGQHGREAPAERPRRSELQHQLLRAQRQGGVRRRVDVQPRQAVVRRLRRKGAAAGADGAAAAGRAGIAPTPNFQFPTPKGTRLWRLGVGSWELTPRIRSGPAAFNHQDGLQLAPVRLLLPAARSAAQLHAAVPVAVADAGLGQLRVLRLDEPEVGAVDVHQLVHRLHLRLGAGEVFRAADEAARSCRSCRRISRETAPRSAALAISMLSNIGILCFFKYYDFGIANLNAVLTALGFGEATFQALHIALPIGISFYTFQSMSYAHRRLSRRRATAAQPDRLRLLRRRSSRI